MQSMSAETAPPLSTTDSAQSDGALASAIIDRFIEGGAGSGQTVADNEASWKQYSIRPRMFRQVSAIDTSLHLLGRQWPSPVIVAPTGGHQLLHEDGATAVARATRRVGSLVGLASGLPPSALEDAAHAAGPYLQQLYLPRQREAILPLVHRAVQRGALAFLLTVDNPRVATLQSFRLDARAYLRPASAGEEPLNADSGANHADETTLDDVQWLVTQSPIPVFVKGILDARDARDAQSAGAAGIVVSNHGGRQIDYSVTAAQAVTAIREQVGDKTVVLADGGIRDPHDVFTAIALGADGVLAGRPILRALKRGGEQACVDWLTEMQRGLALLMASGGYPSLDDISPDAIHHRSGAYLRPL